MWACKHVCLCLCVHLKWVFNYFINSSNNIVYLDGFSGTTRPAGVLFHPINKAGVMSLYHVKIWDVCS